MNFRNQKQLNNIILIKLTCRCFFFKCLSFICIFIPCRYFPTANFVLAQIGLGSRACILDILSYLMAISISQFSDLNISILVLCSLSFYSQLFLVDIAVYAIHLRPLDHLALQDISANLCNPLKNTRSYPSVLGQDRQGVRLCHVLAC